MRRKALRREYADINLPKLRAYVGRLSGAATSARLEAEVQIEVPCLDSEEYARWYHALWHIEELTERLEEKLQLAAREVCPVGPMPYCEINNLRWEAPA